MPIDDDVLVQQCVRDCAKSTLFQMANRHLPYLHRLLEDSNVRGKNKEKIIDELSAVSDSLKKLTALLEEF